jgi:hypothetical protein
MDGSYGVTMRGQADVVALPIDRVAEIRQAEHFLALLDHQKAKVCERLEAQLDAMARTQGTGDQCARRRRRRVIEALESERRMIDRMRHALRVRLGLPTLGPAAGSAATH